MRAPYAFNPLDVSQSATHDVMGNRAAEAQSQQRVRPTAEGQKHILGIQGCLWGEMLVTPERVGYMAFPRTIALAERAWSAEPTWAGLNDVTAREVALASAWNQFANQLGRRELPRLDAMAEGFSYRLPPPRAVIRDGELSANVALPGLEIQYQVDGAESKGNWLVYKAPVTVTSGAHLRTVDMHGRSSRVVHVARNSPP